MLESTLAKKNELEVFFVVKLMLQMEPYCKVLPMFI